MFLEEQRKKEWSGAGGRAGWMKGSCGAVGRRQGERVGLWRKPECSSRNIGPAVFLEEPYDA